MCPTFAYTSGNISNLTAGGAANMADIQGPFTDLRSAINGNLDETNVPNLTAAFTTYKLLHRAAVVMAAPSIAVQMMSLASATGAFPPGNASAVPANYAIELDPTDFNANTRTTKLRVRFVIFTNAVAPAQQYTAGLYPIATYAGVAGSEPIINTLGTVITGSTVVINGPPATSRTFGVSADFNFPAAGAYVLGVLPAGATAASALMDHVAYLEMRQV